MGRYRGSSCKMCRRTGEKLFLKASRCLTNKCTVVKKKYPPGLKGQELRKGKSSDYAFQLKEKQKLRSTYGLLERQFKKCFEKAKLQKGRTGHNFLILLERRLDNVVYRLGWAESRNHARQLVGHKHFLVVNNNVEKRVNIPSYLIKPGDIIKVQPQSVNLTKSIKGPTRFLPPWIEEEKEKVQGKILRIPTRNDIDIPINEELIVAYYSK